MRLQDIFVGAIKISDLIYFLSFPLTVTLVLKYFFQQQFVGEHKIQLKNTFGSLVLFFSIVLLNYVTEVKTGTIDLTSTKAHSLKVESVEAIKKIDRPLKIFVFYTSNHKKRLIKTFDMINLESPFLNIKYIDPDQRPDLVKKYKIRKLPAIVSIGEIVKITHSIDEHHIVRSMTNSFRTPQISGSL